MSLTRDEYIKMWRAIISIEELIDAKDKISPFILEKSILTRTKIIKELIESVIGQME